MELQNKRGFTLIELLVVILIIGILSAVAVPQYQVAVEKSKAVQGWVLVKTLTQAQESYKLVNGSYTRNWEELDISVPLESSVSACNLAPTVSSSVKIVSTGDWEVVLDRRMYMYTPAMAVRREGRFRCYALYFQEGKPYCAESIDSVAPHAGNLCKKLGGNSFQTNGAWREYPL